MCLGEDQCAGGKEREKIEFIMDFMDLQVHTGTGPEVQGVTVLPGFLIGRSDP